MSLKYLADWRNIGYLAIVFATPWAGVQAQRDCVLKKDQDSIKVYSCASDHKFKAIRATFTVSASLTELSAFLLDTDKYTEWQYNTVKSKVLKKVDPTEVVYYSVVAAPWPVIDRDMVADLRISQDPVTRVVTLVSKGIPDYVPGHDSLVRVPMSNSHWTLTPISASTTKVDYFIQIDPGGSVPAWMVNMVSTQAPYESFRKLKEKIKTRFTEKPILSFIKDFQSP